MLRSNALDAIFELSNFLEKALNPLVLILLNPNQKPVLNRFGLQLMA